MGKIQLLDIETSNKIAAGEVVERPASVIKELVENSIDAGATKVAVEIKNGGNVLMRVTDNGVGMSPEDASIAFLRHATSKIKSASDLDAIFTLGFRGEALASVGAVSRADVYTKQKGENIGTHVSCEGGEIVAYEENGIGDGTVIEIKDLFYNTPARRKFLKKDVTEAGYITDIMERFILAYPDISFRLINNGKETLYSSGDGKIKNSVFSVYGKDYANAMLDVSYKSDNIEVTGMIGKGNLARPNRNFQSFYVNKRYIKSGILIRACEEAYKNQIMIGKFPVCVLNININPQSIDINVHPTKLEVKFSDEKAVYEAVYYAVKNALYALPNVPEIKKESPENFIKEEKGTQIEIKKEEKPIVLNDIQKKEVIPEPPKKQEVERKEPSIDPLAQFRKEKEPSPVLKISQPEKVLFKEEKKEELQKIQKEDFIKEIPKPATLKEVLPFKIIGQIFSTYIIAECGEEMLLIDQHAAHERLKYEELLKNLNEKQMYPQVLLEPVIVHLSGEEMAEYNKSSDVFSELGFENEEFGERDVLIRTSPQDVEWADVEELFLELLTKLSGGKRELITDKYQRMIYTIACKSAIKANHTLSAKEMEVLVHSVLAMENINTCPHGRPIIIKMTKKEIEKQFKRIV